MDAPGANATLKEDILIYKHIPKKYHNLENHLYTCKWFDYRFMSPVECTRLYAEHYVEAYRAMYRATYDYRRAPYIKPLKHEDIFDYARVEAKDGTHAVLTGLWRGRQFADALGMPYRLFLDNAFEKTLRYWKQPYPPQAQHLYQGWVIEKLADSWTELQRTDLYHADDSRYTNDWYAGTQAQNDHHEWLFAQARMRGEAAPEFLSRFAAADLIPREKIETRLEPEQRLRFLAFSN